MSVGQWIEYIKNAEKTSFISGKLRRIHYKMTDGAEMLEEYSMDTGILVKRGWKKKCDILCTELADDINSTQYNWDIELGEKIQPLKSSEFLVKESMSEVSRSQRWLGCIYEKKRSVNLFCIFCYLLFLNSQF